MSDLRLPIVILFGALLLLACAPTGSIPQGDPVATTPTALLAGGEGSSAILQYDYLLSSEDLLYETRVSEQLPVLFFIDTADPRAGTIVAGGANGSEQVRIQGLNQGGACWVEITYTVRYDITGSFDPALDCQLALRVTAVPDHGKTVIGGDCPTEFTRTLSTEMLFIAPYEGPFEFVRPYNQIMIDFGSGTRASASLQDIRLPAGTGCP